MKKLKYLKKIKTIKNIKKIINNKNIKINKNINSIMILFLLLFLFIFISAYSYVSAISNNLYDSVFRLHIIANSDSNEDQNLKYVVRDDLIKYLQNSKNNFSTKESFINYTNTHINELKYIAENTIKKNGFDYSVNLEVGNFVFPTKNYGDITFPTGSYDALKVKIGKAAGKNWWCVMFPPLCFINSTSGIVPDESKQTLKQELSEENYKIISETKNPDITVKFKIIEFFQNHDLITAKNN